jgi:hypothetical protein
MATTFYKLIFWKIIYGINDKGMIGEGVNFDK